MGGTAASAGAAAASGAAAVAARGFAAVPGCCSRFRTRRRCRSRTRSAARCRSFASLSEGVSSMSLPTTITDTTGVYRLVGNRIPPSSSSLGLALVVFLIGPARPLLFTCLVVDRFFIFSLGSRALVFSGNPRRIFAGGFTSLAYRVSIAGFTSLKCAADHPTASPAAFTMSIPH